MKKAELNALSGQILDAAIEVHRILGPGLFESVYEHCLVVELKRRGVEVKRQVVLPVYYKGDKLELGFRLDLLVKNEIIVEIKVINNFSKVHEAQIITYLKLAG
jgi:GxxExxY protein